MSTLQLNFIKSKYGPTAIMPLIDCFVLINPDGSRKEISFNQVNIDCIDKLNDYVTEFRKEHGIKPIKTRR